MMDNIDFREIRDKMSLASLPKPALFGLCALATIAVVASVTLFVKGEQSAIRIESAEASSVQQAEAEQPKKTIYVHLTGCVSSPGLIELAEGDRVATAIEMAGGFTDQADVSSINLARQPSDGEQLYVASKDDGAESLPGETSMQTQGSTASRAEPANEASGKINLNKATASELTTLPGIGDSTAQKIVSDRTANGPYRKVDDITRVSGIGEKKLEAIRDLICI